MKKTMLPLRTHANSLRELLDWGWISYKVYKRYKLYDLDFDDAMAVIQKEGLLNDCREIPTDLIIEYINNNKVDISAMNVNEFVLYCLKLVSGKINPSVLPELYNKLKG